MEQWLDKCWHCYMSAGSLTLWRFNFWCSKVLWRKMWRLKILEICLWQSFTHQSKAQINASFDPLYYYGGHKRHWSASSLKLHEVRILSVFQGKHGPQIAEEQLFFRVLANHIQQLFVHLCLILFALIGHSIHLQTECCLSVSMASYIVHKLKVQ